MSDWWASNIRMSEDESRAAVLDSDVVRSEQPWLHESESLLASWRTQCVAASENHTTKARRLKQMHIAISVTGLVIPGLMAPMTAIAGAVPGMMFVEMTAFAVSSVVNSVSAVMNYGGRSERHFAFAGRYADIVTDIDAELTKPRRFRQPVDTFTLRTKMSFDTLNLSAPDA